MKTLTDIEVQYVSGGFNSAPPPSPSPSPNPSPPNKPWYEDITDTIINGMRRVTDAIAGAAEDIGAGIRALTDDGPETKETTFTLGTNGLEYESKATSCGTGQELDGNKCTYPKGN